MVGHCLMLGEGVALDLVEAVKWYRKAAEQGFSCAQQNLAVCYEKGDGVKQDSLLAAKWYHKAAEQGIATAQYSLGEFYRRGKDVQPDMAEAARWYRRAAEQGHATAQNNLGVCYEKGLGVPKDQAEAEKWFKKVAEQKTVQQSQPKNKFLADADRLVRILLLGHDQLLMAATKKFLEGCFDGCVIIECPNGDEAWRQIELQRPDLLITEYKLPGLSLEEMFHRFSQRGFKFPVIVRSGIADEVRERLQSFQGFSIKLLNDSLSTEELKARVLECLNAPKMKPGHSIESPGPRAANPRRTLV